jgi:DNA-binding SARP family transcriptional activator
VRVEYRVLGPLEAIVDGVPAKLGGPKQRATLALLLLQANAVVPTGQLIDGLWPDDPPNSAANLVQGYVSGLRKALGKGAIETRGTGYLLRAEADVFDAKRFERLVQDGSRALEQGNSDEAANTLTAALALWRGPALADLDERGLAVVAARLEELRVLATERRIEAELSLGRAAELVTEVEELVRRHPLRERPRGLLMLALYRSERQAEALDAYRVARSMLVDELGIEPSAWLSELHTSMLRHDPSLDEGLTVATRSELRSILVGALSPTSVPALVAIAAPLAESPRRELVLLASVASPSELSETSGVVHAQRSRLVDAGFDARAAAFTSATPGVDVAKLAREHDVDLLVVDAPERLLEDARVLAILDQAPCDVAVAVDGESREGPILVAFAGADHDWAAVELGAWLARSRGTGMIVLGAAASGEGRDASMLLANASIAVQRALGVAAEPRLVTPEPAELVLASADAGVVVVGLTERWRREGLGRARTALALETACPTLLVRRGVRPGGLAPKGSETRFTWTIAG